MTITNKQAIVLKIALLFLFLVLLVLVQSRVVTFASGWIHTLTYTVLLFGLPGVLLSYAFLKGEKWSALDRLVISFVMGIQALALVATVMLILRTSLRSLSLVILLFDGILSVAWVVQLVRRYRDSAGLAFDLAAWRARAQRSFATLELGRVLLVVAFLVTLAYLLYTLTVNAYALAMAGDKWTYQAYIRHYADTGRLDPTGAHAPWGDVIRMGFIGWPALLSLVLKVTQVDLPDIYNVYLPIFLSGVSVLSFHTMNRTLFKKREQALFVSIVYVLYLIVTLAPDPNGLATRGGHRMLAGVVEDKSITLFLFLPVAMALMFSFLRGSKRAYFLFALSSAAMAATHPFGFFGLGLFVGLFALVRLAAQSMPFVSRVWAAARGRAEPRPRGLWRQYWASINQDVIAVALLLLAVVVFVFFPLIQRSAYFGIQYDPDLPPAGEQAVNPELSPLGLESLEQSLIERHVIMLDPNRFVMAPSFVQRPMIILAILLSPLLFLFVRRDIAAQFLVATFPLPLLLVYFQPTATLLSQLIVPGQLYRIGWILPVGQVIGYVGYELVALIRDRIMPAQSPLRYSRAWLPVLVLAAFAFLIRGQLAEGVQDLQEFHARWVYPAERDRDVRDMARYLDGQLSTKSTVLAEYRFVKYLPAFTAKTRNLLAKLEPERSQVEQALADLNNLQYIDLEAYQFFRDNDIGYVIWHRGLLPNYQFELLTSDFRLLYQNDSYNLYQVISLTPTHTIVGNSYLLDGDFSAALNEYQAAITQDPTAAAAYYGLGQVYYELGDLERATVNYRQAFRLSPDPLNTQKYIRVDVDSEYLPAYLAFGDDYPTPGPVETSTVVVHDLLQDLGPGRTESEPHRSVFIIDGQPKAVLFQHPPSSRAFTVTIPPGAQLALDLALAPGAWPVGHGDGVTFHIELDDGSERSTILAEYIDPKNVRDDRKWHESRIDLSSWAGQAVTLTLTTGCGPNDSCIYDWAGWGQPRIVQPIAYDFLDQFPQANVSPSEPGEVYTATQMIHYDERPVLVQSAPARVRYTVTLPQQSALYLGLGMDPQPWGQDGDGVEYNVYVRDPDEPRTWHQILSRYVDPKSNPDDRRWFDEQVDLSRFGGRTVEIIFETLPGPHDDTRHDEGGWSRPVIVDNTPPGNPGTEARDPERTP